MSRDDLITRLLQSCAPSVRIRDVHGDEVKLWWVPNVWADKDGYVCLSRSKPHANAEEL